MGRQVIEIVDEHVELAMKTHCESFWLHDIDGEPTKITPPSAMQTHEPKTNVVP
jgi:hypothetical protein